MNVIGIASSPEILASGRVSDATVLVEEKLAAGVALNPKGTVPGEVWHHHASEIAAVSCPACSGEASFQTTAVAGEVSHHQPLMVDEASLSELAAGVALHPKAASTQGRHPDGMVLHLKAAATGRASHLWAQSMGQVLRLVFSSVMGALVSAEMWQEAEEFGKAAEVT